MIIIFYFENTLSNLAVHINHCKFTFDVYFRLMLLILSNSCALLYSNTPAITKIVPNAESPVTGLLNNKIDSHIRKALLAVFATLKQ